MRQILDTIAGRLRAYILPGIILLGLAGTFYIGYRFRQGGNEGWLMTIEVGTSMVLSLALVFVYVIQNEILEQQSEIMSGGYTPAIALENVDFVDRDIEDFAMLGSYGDSVTAVQFKIENRGNDVATDVAVICYLFTHESFVERLWWRFLRSMNIIPGYECGCQYLFSPRQIELDSKHLLTEFRQSDGPVLPPEMDEQICLFGNLGVNYNGENYCSIPDACDNLAEDGVEYAYLGLVLRYENAFGDTYELPIQSSKIDGIEKGLSLDDIREKMKRVPEKEFRVYSGTKWTR